MFDPQKPNSISTFLEENKCAKFWLLSLHWLLGNTGVNMPPVTVTLLVIVISIFASFHYVYSEHM